MKFTKIHGLGNDYLYINNLSGRIKNPNELSIKLSNRHLGVGADGIILLEQSKIADYKMRIFNADGTEAEMCGNGIRGLAKYIYENNIDNKENFTIETKAGVRKVELVINDNKIDYAIVDMGEIILNSKDIPVNIDKNKCINEKINVDNHTFEFTALSVGNPHCVIFMNAIEKLNLNDIGYKLEHHPLFPNKTNVEFIEIIDKNNIKMRVWERGSGETLACGTGATASVVAGILTNRLNNNCTIHLPKGILNVYYNENTNHAYLKGTNETVFEGKIKTKKGR